MPNDLFRDPIISAKRKKQFNKCITDCSQEKKNMTE